MDAVDLLRRKRDSYQDESHSESAPDEKRCLALTDDERGAIGTDGSDLIQLKVTGRLSEDGFEVEEVRPIDGQMDASGKDYVPEGKPQIVRTATQLSPS